MLYFLILTVFPKHCKMPVFPIERELRLHCQISLTTANRETPVYSFTEARLVNVCVLHKPIFAI